MIPIVISVILLLIIIFPNSVLLLGLTQIAVAVLFLIFGNGEQWYVELSVIVVIIVLVLSSESDENEGTSGVIKTIIFYFQIISILPYSFRPLVFQELFEVITGIFVVDLKFNSLSCNFSLFSQKNAIVFFVLKMIIPFAIILLLYFIIFAQRLLPSLVKFVKRKACKKKQRFVEDAIQEDQENERDDPEISLLNEGKEEFAVERSKEIFNKVFGREENQLMLHQPWKHVLLKICLFVIYISHFDVTVEIFSVFNCVSPPNFPQESDISMPKYLETMPWITCNTIEGPYFPLFILGIFFGMLFVLGIPVLFGMILFFNRKSIVEDHPHTNKNLEWFSFYYQNYKIKNFWFELVWMLRRTLIALAFNISLLQDYPNLQRILISFLILFFVILNQYIQPFRMNKENLFELAGSLVLLITYIGSFSSTTDQVLVWFIFSINLLFVLSMFFALCYFPFKRAVESEKFQKCKNKILCCARSKDAVSEQDQASSYEDEEEEDISSNEDQKGLHNKYKKMSINRREMLELKSTQEFEEEGANKEEEILYLQKRVSNLTRRLHEEKEFALKEKQELQERLERSERQREKAEREKGSAANEQKDKSEKEAELKEKEEQIEPLKKGNEKFKQL